MALGVFCLKVCKHSRGPLTLDMAIDMALPQARGRIQKLPTHLHHLPDQPSSS